MPSTIRRREFLRNSVAAASASLLSFEAGGCCPCTLSTHYAWNNALHTDGIDPSRVLEPSSLLELVELIQAAEKDELGVRMAGAGHSFSDVAMSKGYQLRPWQLGRPLELDRTQLKLPYRDDASLFRAEGGMRLRQLNPLLFARGHALQNMGGYDAQTIVGAASTGTHGSGLAFGPIASQIVSVQLVTTGGQVVQIEPSDGITDPVMFPNRIDTDHGPVAALLEQSDETFNAVTVSMGCMGVIYAVVLRTVPRFWLREVRELTTWGDLTKTGGFLERLLAGQRLEPDRPADPSYYEILFNPYPSSHKKTAGAHRCLLTKRYRIDEEPHSLTADERKRGRWGVGPLEAVAAVTGRGDSLVDFFNTNPNGMPRVIDDALDALSDNNFVDVSYDVFNQGPANLIRAVGTELGFDVKQTVAAIERHFAIAAQLRADKIMHSSPPSLRFVKSSDAHLAMMNGRNSMMLEIAMIVCANNADELHKTYERRYMAEFGARPHWGLDLNVLQSFDQVRALYPQAERWLAVYRRFNTRGTFNAEFTDRLGISVST